MTANSLRPAPATSTRSAWRVAERQTRPFTIAVLSVVTAAALRHMVLDSESGPAANLANLQYQTAVRPVVLAGTDAGA